MPITLYDVNQPADVSARQLPRLVGLALRLLWRSELRGVVRRELRWSIMADAATAAILGGTLLGVAALATGHTLGVPGAAAAAGAIVLFGERAAFAGNVAGMLFESAMFLDDLVSFLWEVVEHGSHEELLAADGLYAEMFSLQARAYR